LTPEQFWSLTVREFHIKREAFIRAETRAQWLIGLHAMLTTEYEKKPQSPSQVLGWRGMVIRYPEKKWLNAK
jgi:hypothetical protein